MEHTDDPRTFVRMHVEGGDQSYCVCDTGLCMAEDAHEVVLARGSVTELFEWPGRNWHGPSDTGEPLGEAFPPGSYEVIARFVTPSAGEVTARLPITVVAAGP